MPRRSFDFTATPRDTVLLLHGMMLLSDFRDEDMSSVFDAYVHTIPELRDADIGKLKEHVATLRLERPKAEWTAALSEISSEVVKQKTLILALDIAMASGGMVDPGEDDLLDDIRTALGIDLEFRGEHRRRAVDQVRDVVASSHVRVGRAGTRDRQGTLRS